MPNHCFDRVAILATALIVSGCSASLRPGVKAPELAAGKWIKGSQVTLANKPANQVTVVEFWAPW